MIDLGNLSADQGINFDGIESNGLLGFGLGGADINGDGFADLLLGAPGATVNSVANSGVGYVVFGAEFRPTDTTAFDELQLALVGFDNSFVGGAFASGGDIDNDGFEDILVGAPGTNGGIGAAHVLFGGSVDPGNPIDLTTIGDAGFSVRGVNLGDFTGRTLAVADYNNDGVDDFIVGSSGDDQNDTNAGAAAVIFGPATSGDVIVNNLGDRGFNIFGNAADDRIGEGLAVGDFDGDGDDDIAVGSGYSSDKVSVLFGGTGGGIFNDVTIGDANTTIVNSTISGNNPLAAGDFNGDGIDDLIIGAPARNSGGPDGGGVFALSGDTLLSNTTLTDDQLLLQGNGAGQQFGRSVANLGDVNGDGIDDFVVGTDNNEAVVVFGNRDLFPSNSFFDPDNFFDIDNNEIPGSKGMLITGAEPGDRAGYTVAAPGDVNGDGLNDILIGSPDANGDLGRATLLFGTLTASPTTGNDRLISGFQSDNLAGGDGDDSLFGNDGDDTILGENGNDLLAGGGDNDSIDGGAGNDTGYGQAGDDILHGNDGDDLLRGNPGNDLLLGEADNDILRGQPGNDSLQGDDGADNLFGGADSDLLQGDAGNDTIGGNSGTDSIEGGDGDDLLRGQGGADTMSGGDGDDILRGQQGFDVLFGGAGDDLLSGGPADDMLTGGDGSDTIESAQNLGADTGLDFDPLEDMISIVGFSFADLTITATPDGARITITLEGDSPTMALLLSNIDAADVNAGLFVGG